jgi:hypothetical protein
MQFTNDGKPETFFRRGERYTSSFLFRRANLSDSLSLECLILVYVGRPIETGNSCMFPLNIDQNLGGGIGDLQIWMDNPSPNGPDREFGVNSWIMDLTQDSFGRPNWNKFYQIQTYEKDAGSNKFIATLDRPITRDIGFGSKTFIWVDYLFGVFNRGSGQ